MNAKKLPRRILSVATHACGMLLLGALYVLWNLIPGTIRVTLVLAAVAGVVLLLLSPLTSVIATKTVLSLSWPLGIAATAGLFLGILLVSAPIFVGLELAETFISASLEDSETLELTFLVVRTTLGFVVLLFYLAFPIYGTYILVTKI